MIIFFAFFIFGVVLFGCAQEERSRAVAAATKALERVHLRRARTYKVVAWVLVLLPFAFVASWLFLFISQPTFG